MKLRHMLLGVLAAAPLALAIPAAAQPAAVAVPGVLDAEASRALDRMGAYLRTLKNFEVTATGAQDEVYPNGQKLQTLTRTTYLVSQPDKMRVRMEGDTYDRTAYYDGKVMSLYGAGAKKYVRFSVTGSLDEVLKGAYDKYGVDFPLQDLFRWGSPSAMAERPKEGFKVGEAELDGQIVEHYAFRQDGVDFQVWINQGDRPLPRRLVITDADAPGQPQYAVNFRWNLAPKIAAGSFAFTPKAGDTLIDYGTAAKAGK